MQKLPVRKSKTLTETTEEITRVENGFICAHARWELWVGSREKTKISVPYRTIKIFGNDNDGR